VNRPMTTADRERARADYLADPDVTVQQLADEYGVSRSAMLRALVGITRPKGGQVRSALTTAEMLRLRDQGLTLEYIGRQAGLTKSQVSRRLAGRTH
jgi:ABC-type transport system involved in cytochrome c biogenesis ATPase subunit